MSARGFTTAEIEPDGTRHVRWLPAPKVAEDERSDGRGRAALERAKDRKARKAMGKSVVAALEARGSLYRWDRYHWQVRDAGRVVFEFWTNEKGGVAWRLPGQPTRKGTFAQLAACLPAAQPATDNDGEVT